MQKTNGRTFDGLAVPHGSGARHSFGDGPVLVAGLDGAHGELRGVPGGFDDIGFAPSHRVLSGGADNDGFRADGGKSVDVGSEVDLDHVVLGKCLLGEGI